MEAANAQDESKAHVSTMKGCLHLAADLVGRQVDGG